MATGRGQGSRQPKGMEEPEAVKPRELAPRMTQLWDKSSSASSRSLIERMPSEVLLKILSYLDSVTLFSISCVSRQLFELANDNCLWREIYRAELGTRKSMKLRYGDERPLKMATVELQGGATGYWKWQYFTTVSIYDMDKWIRHLRLTKSHTGLPPQTERLLGEFQVSWELTVADKSGHQVTHEMSRALFFKTSVTLCCSRGGCLPDYQHISTLQLHGVRSKARHHPGPDNPVLRSLVAELDMQTLAESVQVLDQDRVVELRLLQPGIIFGIWKENTSQADDQRSIAFVMVTLHLHGLVEKSILGSPVCPYVVPPIKPPFDDIDPEYGLHGYQLNLVLHDTACEIMSQSFYQLSCKRDQICDGLIQLTAVSWKDVSRHIPLSGNITLPWGCEVLQGTVQNCCIMNLTLLDEFKNTFWCVSSPVSVAPEETSWSYHYDGEHSLIHYKDSDGQVKMELAWMEERQQLFLMSLVVYVNVGKVNEHFCRDY